MDPEKPVIIGESVTRVIEGEPFLHPEIKRILEIIRVKMPETIIRLTTNGTMIEREVAAFIASLGNIEICLSLNSADVKVRKYLMNDERAETAVRSAVLLAEYGIPYHGSMVLMPHITGWHDIAGTLDFFEQEGAVTVRALFPGYTGMASKELVFPPGLRKEMDAFIRQKRNGLTMPVTLDPPLIVDLNAEVAGIIKGSPAQKSGILPGDVIISVDGKNVLSRVDAFQKVLAAENPQLEVSRVGSRKTFVIVKSRDQSSGLVFDYDLDPSVVADIRRAVRRRRADRPLLLTSRLGYKAVSLGLETIFPDGASVQVIPVQNCFFGGSIGCAGLLTVADMLIVAADHYKKTDLLIIPGIAFDSRGRDITGRSFLEMESGGALVEAV